MSDDLIKRSDAIEAIEVVDWYHQNRNKDMVSGANSDDHQAWYKADDVYKALEAVSTADRSRGHWVDGDGNVVPLDKNGCPVGSAFCSRCGEWLTASDEYYVTGNFCPNCGALMKGTDNGN